MERVIRRSDCSFPQRMRNAHKGQSGRVLIVGGSEEFVGALVLAGIAAFKAGVDLVEVAAPVKVAWAVNACSPSLITHKLRCRAFSPRQVRPVLRLAARADVVLLGNGLGRTRERLLFVKELLSRLEKPVVVDADALHATHLGMVRSKQWVMTPHQKEFEALLSMSGVDEAGVKKFLSDERVILLKGAVDRIMTGKDVFLNKTGVPEMAVGGTGDVLAGLCAGFLAQGLSAVQAAVNAAWLNGKAGERAKKKYGCFTPEELLGELSW